MKGVISLAKKIKLSQQEMEAAEKKNIQEARNLSNISKKLLHLADDKFDIKSGIELKTARYNEIINRNLEVTKGVAGGNILDFAQSIRMDEMRTSTGGLSPNNRQDIRKMLTTSSGEIYTYFQEVYQNKYIEIADLKFISKFIPALGEAVQCLLDSVTNSDDLSGTISRTIQPDESMSKEDITKLTAVIESLEKEYKLQKRLKNIVYKSAMVSGKYYIYAIPYSDLFEQYSKDRYESANAMNLAETENSRKQMKRKIPGGLKNVNESWVEEKDGSLRNKNSNNILRMDSYGIAEESVSNAINVQELQNIVNEAKMDYLSGDDNKKTANAVVTALERFGNELSSRVSTVKIIHSSIPEIVLDDLPAMEAYRENEKVMKVNDPNYKGLFDSYFGSTPIDMEAGVVSTDGASTSGVKAEKNFRISGTYVRYIDPKNIIPIRLMNETIGYYYIQSAKRTKRIVEANSNTNNNMLGTDVFSGAFNIGALNDQRKASIVDSIVDSISNSICMNFSKKFVAKNADFKKAIADCITYNGFLDNDYHVQFIDPKYILEFTINEDEEGNGESILAKSLFPAKLLLSLVTARMLNYLNLSGDKQIAHVSKGPIDTHTGRQTQRIIRNMQETKITFSDLLSTNLVFNKFSRNKNILLPRARDGQNLVDFEVMEGQNIDMNPEYEKQLEQWAVLGTGVPSVIMEYMGQSDFAKGFETGNIKYASRVSSIQSDMEEPTTELYNILVENSNLDEEVKNRLVGKFKIKLNRPKTLAIANNNEYLSTLQQMLQMISTIMFGENVQDPKLVKQKDEFNRLAARDYAPYIDWNAFEEYKKQAAIVVADPSENTGNDTDSSGGGSGGFGGMSSF